MRFRLSEMGTNTEKGKRVDLSMNRLARYIIIGMGVAAVAFLLWYFSSMVWYILISTVLSLIGKPIVQLIGRLRIGRWCPPSWVGASVALLCLWLVFAAFFWGMIPLLASQLSQLQSVDPSAWIERFARPIAEADALVARFLPDHAQHFSIARELQGQVGRLFDASLFTGLFTSTAGVVSDLFIALFSISFITFFFLKEESLFVSGLTFFFPQRYESNVQHAMERINNLLRRYFVGILLESLVIMLITFGGLLLLRIPMQTALVIGLLSGILNVIPYVGAIISLGIALVITSLVSVNGGDISLGMTLFLTVLIFLAVRFLDNFFLQPLIYASSANAHPLEIFLVILFAGSVAGVLGMLLAIPAYTVIRVFAKEFFNNLYLVQRLTKNI